MKKLLLIIYTAYCTVVFFSLLLVALLVYFISLIIFPKKAVAILYRYIYYWGNLYLFLTGVKLKISGEEHVRPDTAYVIVANHTSYADMFPLASGLKIPFRPLGKVELKNIPVLGFIFRLTLVFVDRSNAESRRKSLIEMRKILDEKISVVIFPEGTRNRTGKPLKDFYDGAFRLAIETQTPVLPVVFCNCLHMWNNDEFLLHPVTLKMIYLPPVQTAGMTVENIAELKEKVYKQMEAVIQKEDLRFADHPASK
jgi:1-acyl-sn-glycerol-3-phosphate acyltransferase